MLSFTFRNKNSYTDFGIIIKKRPPIVLPERRVEYIDVPGRHGSLTIDDETYSNFQIQLECAFISESYVNRANEIKKWLMGGQDILIFSDESDKYYIAQVVNKVDLVKVINTFGEFLLVFNCQPFKYLIEDEEYILMDKCIIRNATAINPLTNYNGVGIQTFNSNEPIRIYDIDKTIQQNGDLESEPIINIYGSGNVTLTVNNENITINNVESYATIDSEKMDCYKDTQLKNNDMIGNFPKLQAGENTLNWIGQVKKIYVKCNTRFI